MHNPRRCPRHTFPLQLLPALFALGAWLLCTGPARADEVLVAVAANFRAPLEALAPDFEQRTGHHLKITYGGTGRFVAQILAGAPFEVLLAADAEGPARLEAAGLALPGTRRTYVLGRLMLWSADPRRVDPEGAVLRAPEAGPLAVANPRLAPYGRAALETLDALGLRAAWQGRIIEGEDIGQAHRFVHTGAAPLGLLARAQVFRDGRLSSGSGWLVPATLHAPIRQDGVVLLPGRGHPAAQALLDFLAEPGTRARLAAYGYDLP